MEVHVFKSTGYMVLSQGYRVHGFDSTGYLVSRVLAVKLQVSIATMASGSMHVDSDFIATGVVEVTCYSTSPVNQTKGKQAKSDFDIQRWPGLSIFYCDMQPYV